MNQRVKRINISNYFLFKIYYNNRNIRKLLLFLLVKINLRKRIEYLQLINKLFVLVSIFFFFQFLNEINNLLFSNISGLLNGYFKLRITIVRFTFTYKN